MTPKHILVVIGTRPEAIKLAPLILELQSDDYFKVTVCVTGQHKEMLLPILSMFNINIDINLEVMTQNQTLSSLTSALLLKLTTVFEKIAPDLVIVQGDTTTTFTTSLSAFYHAIPICHIEAGLRTYTINSPWPEEGNRQMTSTLATLHAAPTKDDQQNLIHEHVDHTTIIVSGNTVIDALFLALKKIESSHINLSIPDKKIILVTCHRRENIGKPLTDICTALCHIATTHPSYHIVFPVHLNPNIYNVVHQTLGQYPNITLLDPLDYLPFIKLMSLSHIILTDSGGIQEEAPSLNIPVLIMRESTERPQAVTSGAAQLVGTSIESITKAIDQLISEPDLYTKMATAINPFGDGTASKKIVSFLKKHFTSTY